VGVVNFLHSYLLCCFYFALRGGGAGRITDSKLIYVWLLLNAQSGMNFHSETRISEERHLTDCQEVQSEKANVFTKQINAK